MLIKVSLHNTLLHDILPAMSTPSLAQLRRAISISEKIEKMEAELVSILGSSVLASPGKRKYTKRAVAEAGTEEAAPAKKKKRKKMSEEGRAKIVAAQKARWAKIKKAKKAKAKEEAPAGE